MNEPKSKGQEPSPHGSISLYCDHRGWFCEVEYANKSKGGKSVGWTSTYDNPSPALIAASALLESRVVKP